MLNIRSEQTYNLCWPCASLCIPCLSIIHPGFPCDGLRDAGQIEPSGFGSYSLILSRNFREHLTVTTLLGSSIISLPVAGFLPFRCFFSFTQNFPKRLTSTSSPDSKFRLIISSRVSIKSKDRFFV